jgi:hypothetical protein
MYNFHQMIETKKLLVIVNINTENKLDERNTKKIVKIFKDFSQKNRPDYFKEFQFGYTDNSDLLNGIAIWTLNTPIVFVYNVSSHTYNIIDLIETVSPNNNRQLKYLDLKYLLKEIKENKFEVAI